MALNDYAPMDICRSAWADHRRTQREHPFKVVVVGHIDHGKSTIIGRLLHQTGAINGEQMRRVRQASERRGVQFEWAFLLDSLRAERDQGITIETAQTRLQTATRDYVLIDTPGHKEFLKNMVTGASEADAALLVIDGKAGVEEQTRQHLYLLHLLGLTQVIVAVNKMDLLGYNEMRYYGVCEELHACCKRMNVKFMRFMLVPVAARDGEGLATPSPRMAWYQGPPLLSALDAIPGPKDRASLPLRLPIQDVYRFDDRRIVVGRIEAGQLRTGAKVVLLPSRRTAHIASLEHWNGDAPRAASPGQCVALTFKEQIYIEPGELICDAKAPTLVASVIRARIFWLGKEPLQAGSSCRLKLLSAETAATIEQIEWAADPDQTAAARQHQIDGNSTGEVVIRTRKPIAFDDVVEMPQTARFALVDGFAIAGGGIITSANPIGTRRRPARARNITPVPDGVTPARRWQANGHRGGVLWLTGLSCSGKSTLALELERLLFAEGLQVAFLDGDTLRTGLNADLGFGAQDRVENVRRAGEVAILLAQLGLVVIAAFISPYRADRDSIRARAPDLFHEIHISTDLEVCEARDDKGLYRRARRGEIEEFTGVSAPYEPPLSPELAIDTGQLSIDECVRMLSEYVEQQLSLAEQRSRTAMSMEATLAPDCF